MANRTPRTDFTDAEIERLIEQAADLENPPSLAYGNRQALYLNPKLARACTQLLTRLDCATAFAMPDDSHVCKHWGADGNSWWQFAPARRPGFCLVWSQDRFRTASEAFAALAAVRPGSDNG